MLSTRTHQKTTAPAPPLVDYNTGRLEPGAMVRIFGLAAVGLLAGAFPGGALALLCRPPEYGDWGAWRILGFVLGLCLGFLGLVVFWWPVSELRAERREFRERQRVSFDTDIVLREQGAGLVTHEEVSEFEYTAERDDHLFVVVAAFTREKAHNPHFTPSIGHLTGRGVWIGNSKFANVNSNQARVMLATLAEMGFIQGRDKGTAGEWAYSSVDDAIERFERVRR
jgi:hypothetical protein